MADFIDLNKSEDSDGIKKIKAFCITNDAEREEYEDIVNNEDFIITHESTPSLDKLGRVIIVLKWTEPL